MPLPAPTLCTARLRLRPLDDADATALFAMHSNAHVLRYWDAPPWREPVRAERFIAACREIADEGAGRGWPWTASPTEPPPAGAA